MLRVGSKEKERVRKKRIEDLQNNSMSQSEKLHDISTKYVRERATDIAIFSYCNTHILRDSVHGIATWLEEIVVDYHAWDDFVDSRFLKFRKLILYVSLYLSPYVSLIVILLEWHRQH